ESAGSRGLSGGDAASDVFVTTDRDEWCEARSRTRARGLSPRPERPRFVRLARCPGASRQRSGSPGRRTLSTKRGCRREPPRPRSRSCRTHRGRAARGGRSRLGGLAGRPALARDRRRRRRGRGCPADRARSASRRGRGSPRRRRSPPAGPCERSRGRAARRRSLRRGDASTRSAPRRPTPPPPRALRSEGGASAWRARRSRGAIPLRARDRRSRRRAAAAAGRSPRWWDAGRLLRRRAEGDRRAGAVRRHIRTRGARGGRAAETPSAPGLAWAARSAEGPAERVVKGGPERADGLDVRAPWVGAVRQERDREAAVEIDPEGAAGEAEVADGAARAAAEERARARAFARRTIEAEAAHRAFGGIDRGEYPERLAEGGAIGAVDGSGEEPAELGQGARRAEEARVARDAAHREGVVVVDLARTVVGSLRGDAVEVLLPGRRLAGPGSAGREHV